MTNLSPEAKDTVQRWLKQHQADVNAVQVQEKAIKAYVSLAQTNEFSFQEATDLFKEVSYLYEKGNVKGMLAGLIMLALSLTGAHAGTGFNTPQGHGYGTNLNEVKDFNQLIVNVVLLRKLDNVEYGGSNPMRQDSGKVQTIHVKDAQQAEKLWKAVQASRDYRDTGVVLSLKDIPNTGDLQGDSRSTFDNFAQGKNFTQDTGPVEQGPVRSPR